jgi:hypothetical protein
MEKQLQNSVHRAHEFSRVEVEHRACRCIVAGLETVAGQYEHIADAECGRTEQVALDGDTIAVATGHLQDRLDAELPDADRRREAGHAHAGARAVRQVDGRHHGTQIARRLFQRLQGGAARRRDLGRDREVP